MFRAPVSGTSVTFATIRNAGTTQSTIPFASTLWHAGSLGWGMPRASSEFPAAARRNTNICRFTACKTISTGPRNGTHLAWEFTTWNAAPAITATTVASPIFPHKSVPEFPTTRPTTISWKCVSPSSDRSLFLALSPSALQFCACGRITRKGWSTRESNKTPTLITPATTFWNGHTRAVTARWGWVSEALAATQTS